MIVLVYTYISKYLSMCMHQGIAAILLVLSNWTMQFAKLLRNKIGKSTVRVLPEDFFPLKDSHPRDSKSDHN